MKDSLLDITKLSGRIKSAANFVLNLIYPPVCVFCKERLSPKSKRHICVDCGEELPYCILYERCSRCGKPIGEGIICRCLSRKTYYKRATSPFIYDGLVKDAVTEFKKESGAYMGDTFAIYVAQMVRTDFGGVEFDGVVSVPPRKMRQSKEKFDQAGYLAYKTAKRLGLPYYKNAICQIRDVKKQSTLDHNKRFENVKDAFSVKHPERLADKTLLLIDDVCTTGATITECSRVLKEAGAYRIYAATFATVPDAD